MIVCVFSVLMVSATAFCAPTPPPQPAIGPGGSTYAHAAVTVSGPFYAEGRADDDNFRYFLFEPAEPKPVAAPVVMFLHGWRAFDTAYYRGWIDHIVKKGYTVAWVQYDDGWTLTSKMPLNAMETWLNALSRLAAGGHVLPALGATGEVQTAFVGHSLGAYVGVLLSAMSANPTYGIPKPKAVVAIEPGIEEVIPAIGLGLINPSTKLVLVTADEDRLVCTDTASRIWEMTPQIPDQNRDFLLVNSDYTGLPSQTADHLFPLTTSLPLQGTMLGQYMTDMAVDARDYYVTFKLSVGALNCAFNGTDCDYALGNGSENQVSMGDWSDGQAVMPMTWVEDPSSLVAGCKRHPPMPSDNLFSEIAPQGFGDLHNSKAWSMIWWKDHLYVGTARAHLCVEYAGLAGVYGPPFYYPPNDPEQSCTPDTKDLPLQAEIWRYEPVSRVWDRVFQSPNNVEIPESPGTFTARDAGFRNIIAFTDPDGTEALYAGGVTSEAINPGMPPPRILRSTDGATWTPVPQDPGTILGDLGRGQANWRAMAVYKNRLYAVNADLRGGGVIFESENPAGGNDNFRVVSPEGMKIYEMAVFNGYLYIGTDSIGPDGIDGYAVVKTDATGEPPYTFTSVVEKGGDRDTRPSLAVTSMHVFNGELYVGTDKPAELIRIRPDDSWDLLVGRTRLTPTGRKEALSGMRAGFDDILNQHMWRMIEYDGRLYVGTNDARAFIKEYLWFQPWLENMGYDLASTADGESYTIHTRTGFGKALDIGIRVFASTPYGLFFGTSNPFNGLRIYQSNEYVDDDGDGFSENQGDCNDAAADIYPGADEICGDGIDQDCDGIDPACPAPGDLNGDGCVDRSDYYIIIGDIRNPAVNDPAHDLNGDGVVNIADARYLVTLFTNPRGAPVIKDPGAGKDSTRCRLYPQSPDLELL